MTLVSKCACCATEHWLMSDGVADGNKQVVFGIICDWLWENPQLHTKINIWKYIIQLFKV